MLMSMKDAISDFLFRNKNKKNEEDVLSDLRQECGVERENNNNRRMEIRQEERISAEKHSNDPDAQSRTRKSRSDYLKNR